jgi:hypothetical protein
MMKKTVMAVLLGITLAGPALGLDAGLSVGRNTRVKADVTQVSVGTDILGLRLSGEFETARNQYHAYGVSLGKEFPVLGSLSLGGKVGVSRFDSVNGKDGTVGRYGVSASYALAKNVAVVGDITRSFNVQDAQQFKGNTFSTGVRFTF